MAESNEPVAKEANTEDLNNEEANTEDLNNEEANTEEANTKEANNEEANNEEANNEEANNEFEKLLNEGEEVVPSEDYTFEEVILPAEDQTTSKIVIEDVCSLSNIERSNKEPNIGKEKKKVETIKNENDSSPVAKTEDLKQEVKLSQDNKYEAINSDPWLACSDDTFKETFRVTRSSFENILTILSAEKLEEIENVPMHKRLLIFLWLMGSFTSFDDAAETLHITEDEAMKSFYSVCSVFSDLKDEYVRWPDESERDGITTRVESEFNVDGVVGILAVHYCPLYIPKDAAIRRSHFKVDMKLYCVALQLVIDDQLCIRDVFAGAPGSLSESAVMRRSPLAQDLTKSPSPLVEAHRHVLAGVGLPQLQTTLTPLSGPNLSPAEIRLNRQIESACRLADDALATIRDRFPILTLLDVNEAVDTLQAACVLHNICLASGDYFR